MPHTRSRRRSPYRVLRSEAPSTVAVLATEHDFAVMRGYRTFTFEDYTAYLRHVHALLDSLEAQGIHARVAPFDPYRFAAYCAMDGLDPDASLSRTSYTAEIAGTGLTVQYRGQPCDELLSLLRAHRWQDAAPAEPAAGPPAESGPCEAGEAAFHTAADALDALLAALGPGTHHIVCSVDGPGTPLLGVLQAVAETNGEWGVDESAVLLFCSVLAAGLATGSPGGLVTRTTPSCGAGRRPRETVRGWSLQRGWLAPLTEGEVFSAYCTHMETGDPVPPEPGVDYGAGLPLARPEREGG
jgi:hypothetical protein